MLDKIVLYTNNRIASVQNKYSRFKKRKNSRQVFSPSFIGSTTKDEIEAFIGLLYLSGLFKSGHEDLKSLGYRWYW